MRTLHTLLQRFGYIGSWALVTSTVALLLLADIVFGLESHVWQFDKLLHFLGGFACGIFGAFLASRSVSVAWPHEHKGRIMTLALVSAFVIGGLWELLEITVPAMHNPLGWQSWDTSFDMLFDLSGAFLAARTYQKGAA